MTSARTERNDTAGLTVTPSGGGAGAFVSGIDLADVSAAQATALRSAIGEYGVLFFRGQDLKPENQIAFARHFGNININRFFKANERYPEIALVLKEPDQKVNIGGDWHTDHSYDDAPALGSVLAAVETPPSGGDTIFANTCAAWEGLSNGLKDALSTMSAVHSSRLAFGPKRENDPRSDSKDLFNNPEAATQDSVHPVVVKHPISGRPSLYVNPGFTLHFDGWTRAESKPLLDYLFAWITKPEFTYRFQWAPGSVAFWDNRATWHYALNDYQGHRRLMHRITVEGERLAAA